MRCVFQRNAWAARCPNQAQTGNTAVVAGNSATVHTASPIIRCPPTVATVTSVTPYKGCDMSIGVGTIKFWNEPKVIALLDDCTTSRPNCLSVSDGGRAWMTLDRRKFSEP